MTHLLTLWFVAGLAPGFDVADHYFCVGWDCVPYAEVCVFDDPRADVLCSHTFEAPSIASAEFCGEEAYTIAWSPDGRWKYSSSTQICVSVVQVAGEWR